MDNNPNTPQKVYKSSEIIQAVLDALGLQRTNSSEYVTYTADGKVLRVRVSDHGVNLSAWYRNNEGEVIPLSNSDNIAFTFLPNRDECKNLNIKFPPKVINKTPVYSDVQTKTPIDYEFTVMHYVYSSWKFTEEYLNLLTNAIVNYTTSGKFNDPLTNTSAKAVLFNDTSNKKPQKIKPNNPEIKTENKQYNKNRNMKRTIKLRESELKRMIAESVKGAINELDWKTYANAAKKAREQGRDSRWDFDRATERALDKQYGGHHLVSTDNETYQDFHTYNDDPFSTNYDRAWRPLEGHEDFGSYADVHDSKKPYGNEDVADFVHGRSKYVKGKGWETNESINRKIDRIVSESIRRNIR